MNDCISGAYIGICANKGKTVHRDYAIDYALAMSTLFVSERKKVIKWYAHTFPYSPAITFKEICKEIRHNWMVRLYFEEWWFSGNWIFYTAEELKQMKKEKEKSEEVWL